MQPTETSIHSHISQLLAAMSQDLYEKESTVRMVLLAAIAGESVFLLGPPGVAKSMIARRLKYAFQDARAFEYLMGKFSTPDEVFGPVSIKKLKDEDKYERLYEQYLPGANIVFLDEIWKASPPIQNSLLTVLNEKIFRNGEKEIRVDLRVLIAASNELPLAGEGLEALWDRFLIRMMVQNIEEEHLFAQMLQLPNSQSIADPVASDLKITRETYLTWQGAIEKVILPPHIIGWIHVLRRAIRLRNQEEIETQAPLYVSDRRWRKIIQLLRTSAFLHERNEIIILDCYLISDCIWDQVEQIGEVRQLVDEQIASYGYQLVVDKRPIEAELESLRKEIDEATHEVLVREEPRAHRFKDEKGLEYVRIQDFWGEEDGFIRIKDLAKLKDDGPESLHLFERTPSGFRPFQSYAFTRKSRYELIDDQGNVRTLDTKIVEREERVPRVPSSALQRVWDTQLTLLVQHCDRGIDELEARKVQDEPHLQGHLFVDHARAEKAFDSLQRHMDDLANLKLDIRKLRHQYESVQADQPGTE